MRIREIFFHDFRSFRGPHRISFVDPLTDAVMPISVLAGTNGTGKTTIFETIEALLALVLDSSKPHALVTEARRTGFVALGLEIDPADLSAPDSQGGISVPMLLYLAAGRMELMPDWFRKALDSFGLLSESGRSQAMWQPHNSHLFQRLGMAAAGMQQGTNELYGGLLYFPHDRRLRTVKAGRIERPVEKRQWIFRFAAGDRWQDSLEQLWVWQNYLDLEEGSQSRNNLQPFVASVEDVLGPNRVISIRKGQVVVQAPWAADGEPQQLSLDQLPSGEQQVLLLLGELLRRRRPGAVLAIDEPELSLHPTLQRLLVHRLRKLAREWNMQVLLATHSLEVLRAVHETERILLDRLDQPDTELEDAS